MKTKIVKFSEIVAHPSHSLSVRDYVDCSEEILMGAVKDIRKTLSRLKSIRNKLVKTKPGQDAFVKAYFLKGLIDKSIAEFEKMLRDFD